MKSCVAVMKFITARDVLIHYRGYDFMLSEKSIFGMYAGILSHSGDHHSHSTQSGKQSEIVWSSQPESCLVAWLREL